MDVCALREFYTDGEDSFLCKNEKDMRGKLELLLNDRDLAEKMSKKAITNIAHKCNLDRFCYEWNQIFGMVVEK